MQSRMGRTTAGGESFRPMTAISGAGFQSQSEYVIIKHMWRQIIPLPLLMFT